MGVECLDAEVLPFLKALRSWYTSVLLSEYEGFGAQLAMGLGGLGRGHGSTMVLNPIYQSYLQQGLYFPYSCYPGIDINRPLNAEEFGNLRKADVAYSNSPELPPT